LRATSIFFSEPSLGRDSSPRVPVRDPKDGLGTVLFQTLNKVKIGEETPIAVCVDRAVGRGENRTDVFHACGVGGHELLPQGSTAAGDFQPVNLGR